MRAAATNVDVSHIKAPDTHINADPEVCRDQPHP